MRAGHTLLWCVSGLILMCNYVLWNSILLAQPHKLTVSILDIGQGDSILVRGPTGITMLVDGGPDRSVLRKLPDELGIFRKSLDVLVETHPDKDHIAGLESVFGAYRVSYFLGPGVPDTTAISRSVEASAASEPGLHAFLARRGMRLHLGGGAYADVLYPDRDMSRQTDTNAGSVTMRVVYGKTSFMLTGDLPSPVEDYLVSLDGKSGALRTDVLKAGHHGSKNSSDEAWLAALHPSVAAISAGKGNPYRHPSPEALGRMQKEGARILSTIDHGTLRFISDGTTVQEENEK